MTKTTDNVPAVCAQLLESAEAKQRAAIRVCVYNRTSAIETFEEVAGIMNEVAIQLRSAAIV